MKAVICKDKLVDNSLPKHLIINNRNIFDQTLPIASTNILWMKLASEISQCALKDMTALLKM